MGACPTRPSRAPSSLHTTELRPGDVLLMRRGVCEPHAGTLDAEVAESVALAVSKHLYSCTRFEIAGMLGMRVHGCLGLGPNGCAPRLLAGGWTHCAIVIPMGDVLHFVQATPTCFLTCPVARQVREMQAAQDKVRCGAYVSSVCRTFLCVRSLRFGACLGRRHRTPWML